jgi:hypothetical protein
METLDCRLLEIQHEEDTLVIAFADSETDPRRSLMLQRSTEPSEQDVELNQDQVYILVHPRDEGLYGGIVSARLAEFYLDLHLTPKAAAKLAIDKDYRILLPSAWRKSSKLKAALEVALNPIALT